MVPVIPFLVLIVILAIALGARSAVRKSGSPTTTTERAVRGTVAPSPVAAPPSPLLRLDDPLSRWEAAGLVDARQVASIRAFEAGLAASAPTSVDTSSRAPRRRRSRVPAFAEALGYLGGALTTVGVVLVVSRLWDEIGTAGRLGLSVVTSVALLGASFMVRPAGDPALGRLQNVLWLASTAAIGLAGGVLAVDLADVGSGAGIALCVALAVLVEAGLLWRGRVEPVPQLVTLAALAVSAGTGVYLLAGDGYPGIAVWLVGAGVLGLALFDRLPTAVASMLLGAVTMLVGAVLVTNQWLGAGFLAAIGTAVALLALVATPSLITERAAQLSIGVPALVAVTQFLPATLVHFSGEAGLATGLAVWVSGGVVLALGLRRSISFHHVAQAVGAAALIGGAALTASGWTAFALWLGLATSIALVVGGALGDQLVLSLVGSAGLLVNVPWSIGWFFPGEDRAPLMILVTGAVLVALAVLLTRRHHRVSGAPLGRTDDSSEPFARRTLGGGSGREAA